MDDAKKKTITVTEAAKRLGVSRNLAYEAVRRGEIPCVRLGKRLLVPEIALERMLNGDVAKVTGTKTTT